MSNAPDPRRQSEEDLKRFRQFAEPRLTMTGDQRSAAADIRQLLGHIDALTAALAVAEAERKELTARLDSAIQVRDQRWEDAKQAKAALYRVQAERDGYAIKAQELIAASRHFIDAVFDAHLISGPETVSEQWHAIYQYRNRLQALFTGGLPLPAEPAPEKK